MTSKLLNLGDALIKAGVVTSNRVHRRHKVHANKEERCTYGQEGVAATRKKGHGELGIAESDTKGREGF